MWTMLLTLASMPMSGLHETNERNGGYEENTDN